MHAARTGVRFRQKGMVSVMAAILLISAVIFALIQTRQISGTSSIENELQMDSTAALFLAESGLESGVDIINSAGDPTSGSTCTNINVTNSPAGSSGNYSLRGASADCVNGNCDCILTSTGMQGSASRTIQRNITFTKQSGVSGTGTTATMQLRNSGSSTPSVALFSLATTRGGANTTASCNSMSGATCQTGWNVNSSNGNSAVEAIGTAVLIDPGQTASVVQTMNSPQTFAEVGAFLPGMASSATPPAIVGYYWDQQNNCDSSTVCNSQSGTGGAVRNGASASGSGTCLAWSPSNPQQSCSNWCFADTNGNLANTLVFGFTGKSNAAALDSLGSVTVNGIALGDANGNSQALAKYPPSPWDVYSEIWVKQNPAYLSGAVFTGSIAASVAGPIFSAGVTSGSNTLTVSGITSSAGSLPSGSVNVLRVGDTISGTGIPANTTIQALGTGSGGAGTYTMSAAATSTSSIASGASTRTILTVTAVASGVLYPGEALSSTGSGTNISSGTTIAASGTGTGSGGTYYLSPSQTVTPRTMTSGPTSSGTTIAIPSGMLPAVGTLLAVRSGTGKLASNTTVTSVNPAANTFTVSAAPTPALAGAQICGGACALFDHTSSTTSFTISKSGGTRQWAAGFMCVSNAGLPNVVSNTKVTPRYWQEVVQ